MSDEPRETSPAEDAADRTRPLPRSEETVHQAEETGDREPAPAVWSGRAGVPVPRPAAYREPSAVDWYAEEQAGRRWWTPIALGILALLLLGMLGLGIWLILQATQATPREDSSTTPTSAPATSAVPTTEATTSRPSTTSATSVPVDVPMPPVVGLPQASAERILEQLGIAYRIERRESDQPAGTVIETDPEPGWLVPAGEEATLVVAVPAATPSAPPSPTGTATPTP